MPKVTVAIEGTTNTPAGKELASGTGHILGGKPWVIFQCTRSQARSLIKERTVFPAKRTRGGWHYNRRPLRVQDV